jgi:hypothetical protein
VCGATAWINASGVPQTEGRMVVEPAVRAASALPPGAEDFAVGSRPALLGFDLRRIAGGGDIDRAVLFLAPSRSWRTGTGPIRLFARAVTSPWTASSIAANGPPAMSPDPTATVQLPGSARVPVRIDVTAAVRAWVDGASRLDGIAVSTDGAALAFMGPLAESTADRPRLEVVFR